MMYINSINTNGIFVIDPVSLKIGSYEILWFDYREIASTMDTAKEILKTNYKPWTVITTGKQTKGRGTHGRTWSSLPGKGLWMSVILPMPLNNDKLENLSFLAAESLIRCLNRFSDISFQIKNPNDVIVNGRKIAGILLESSSIDSVFNYIIMGLGLNITQTARDFKNEGLHEATSLFIEGGRIPERKELITVFLDYFISAYNHETAGT